MKILKHLLFTFFTVTIVSKFLGSSLNDHITIHSVVLNLSNEQENELIDFYLNNNNGYNLYSNNCAQFVNSGLEKLNLKQFKTGALIPNRFFNRVIKDKTFSSLIKNYYTAKNVSNINLDGSLTGKEERILK